MLGQPQRFGDRFAVERLLGSGGWGTVYAVHDEVLDANVALKHLRRLEPESLIRFKREFRAIAELDDPNLVRLYELFGDEHGWYYTMEHVDGAHLTTALGVRHVAHPTFDLTESSLEVDHPAGGAAVDQDRVRALFGQLAHALEAVHAAGLLHRDLKPSNVLVSGDRVVLLDFGIVGDATSSSSGSVGTPAYMAPEQALPEVATTPAADWYAFGVMLFEVLTGRLPFSGDPRAMIEARQSRDAPDPRELEPAAPPDLAELCTALLRRDPSLRPTGAEVIRRLGAAPSLLPPPRRFVGRRSELAVLHRALDTRAPGVVLLEGISGQGKTALATAFLRELRDEHPKATVLTGRSRAQESVPFKALDGVFDGLAVVLEALDPAEARALVPGGARALGELFPVLLQVEAFAARAAQEGAAVDVAASRRLAVAALRLLLRRLCDRGPTVILLDDLHWGDLDSAALIGSIWAPPDPPPVLWVATARPEPSACLDWLRTAAAERDVRFDAVELGPLGRAESLELLGASGARAQDADRLADQAGGHPWLLDVVMRYASSEPGPVALDQVLGHRIAALTESSRTLLALCAIAGRPVDRRVVRAASGLDSRFDEAMHALEVARLVRYRRTGTAGGIECYHDRIRETVLQTLDPATRRAHHASLAQALSATPEELLVHLVEAGLHEEAADLAAHAADQARASFAFVLAAEHYATALRCLGDRDPARRFALSTQRAEALADAGRMVDAAHAFLDAADHAPDGDRRAIELRRRGATQLLLAGRLDEGLAVARGVCSEVGLAPPAGPRWSVAQVVGGRVWLKLRGLAWVERAEADCDPAELLRHDTLETLADGLGVVDTARAAALRQRSLQAALSLGEPRRVAVALLGLAQSSALPGGQALPEARRVFELARPLVERLDDPRVSAFAAVTEGGISYLTGRPVDCAVHMQRALDLSRDHREVSLYTVNQARVFRVYGAYYGGDLETARTLVELWREIAFDSGNLFLSTFLATAEASILLPARDDPERGYAGLDAALRDWSQLDYNIQHWWALKARCDLDLYCGLPQRCLDRLAHDWPRLDGSLLHRVEAARLTNLFLRARASAAVGDGTSVRSAHRDLADIERTTSALTPAYAAQVRAELAHAEGRTQDRDLALTDALAAYRSAGLGFFELTGRMCADRLAGREPDVDALVAHGVRAPWRFVRMFWPVLGAVAA